MKQHIKSIDYLRGVLALCIVLYHYLSWTHSIEVNSNQILFRIALYGVSIFFIISGFSLVIAYRDIDFLKINNIIMYFRKRIARIYPLFWLVIIISVIIDYRYISEIREFLIQFTIFFGIFGKGGLTPGAWSIGIEIIFYLFFPILMLLSSYLISHSKITLLVIYLFLIGAFLYTSMFHNNYFLNMGDKYFKMYVLNFCNHAYFFLFGMLLAFFYEKVIASRLLKKYYILLVILSATIFILPKVSIDEYYFIIDGVWRLVFSLASFIIFTAFLFNKIESNLLSFFGKISYTLYLTHPVSFYILNKIYKISDVYTVFIALIFSIIVAVFIYYLYEEPLKKIITNFRIS